MRAARHMLAIAAAFTLLGCSGEEIEIETGYRGAARRDPFLAAERFLTENSFNVSTHTWLRDQLPGNGTLIATAQSFGNHGTTEKILEWVWEGGNLLLLLEGGETFRSDWSDFTPADEKHTHTELTELLDALGIEKITDDSGTLDARLDGATASVKMPARFQWRDNKAPEDATVIASEKNSVALATLRHGSGRVAIAAHAEPFRNRHLGDADNAWLLLHLVNKPYGGEVWFLNGMRISFFGMLWERGWMALLAAAALLAVWLWRSLPRFGPLRAPEETGTRDFAEHLSLTGAFLWQHRQRAQLIAPLREAVTRAAVRRGMSRSDEDFPEKLAALVQMDALRVRAALLSENVADPRSFLRAIQDLRALHEKMSA